MAVIFGSNVVLQCTVSLSHSIGPNYSALIISWQHNNTSVLNCTLNNLTDQLVQTFYCSHTIANVSNTEIGPYKCTAKIEGGNISSDEHDLEVLGKHSNVCIHNC